MRHHDICNISDCLGTCLVFGVDIGDVVQLFDRLGSSECVFVNDARAGAVYDYSSGLHAGEEVCREHLAGGVGLRDVESDDVGLAEELFQRNGFDTGSSDFFAGDERVIAKDVAIEAAEAFCNEAADVAKAYDADGFAGEFGTHEEFLFPFAGADGCIGGDDVAHIGEDEGDYFFGDCVGICTWGVHYVYTALAGIFGVDCVITSTGTDDDL